MLTQRIILFLFAIHLSDGFDVDFVDSLPQFSQTVLLDSFTTEYNLINYDEPTIIETEGKMNFMLGKIFELPPGVTIHIYSFWERDHLGGKEYEHFTITDSSQNMAINGIGINYHTIGLVIESPSTVVPDFGSIVMRSSDHDTRYRSGTNVVETIESFQAVTYEFHPRASAKLHVSNQGRSPVEVWDVTKLEGTYVLLDTVNPSQESVLEEPARLENDSKWTIRLVVIPYKSYNEIYKSRVEIKFENEVEDALYLMWFVLIGVPILWCVYGWYKNHNKGSSDNVASNGVDNNQVYDDVEQITPYSNVEDNGSFEEVTAMPVPTSEITNSDNLPSAAPVKE